MSGLDDTFDNGSIVLETLMVNKERMKLLLSILDSYATTEQAVEYMKNFTMHGETDSEMVLYLVGAIYDGLAHGNWPWVIAEMNRVKR